MKNNVTKTQLRNYVDLAVRAAKNGLKDFALFNLKREKTTVQFKYCFDGFFSIVDFNDPYDGMSHGYPKLWQGDIDAFYDEFQRELNYIDEIHNENE